jgi:hypothetical protein
VQPEHALCQLSYFLIKMGAQSGAKWCSEKDLNPHLLVRSQPLYPLSYPNDSGLSLGKGKLKMVTHGGLEPPPSRSQTERDTITLMSDVCQEPPSGFEQGFAVGILPMNRLPGSLRLRASAAIFHCLLVWITEDGRLERGGETPARLSPVKMVARGRIELPSGGS